MCGRFLSYRVSTLESVKVLIVVLAAASSSDVFFFFLAGCRLVVMVKVPKIKKGQTFF